MNGQQAAGYVVTLTKPDCWAHGRTLGEIDADERAGSFWRWALSQPGQLQEAAAAFLRLYRPELYRELVRPLAPAREPRPRLVIEFELERMRPVVRCVGDDERLFAWLQGQDESLSLVLRALELAEGRAA